MTNLIIARYCPVKYTTIFTKKNEGNIHKYQSFQRM